MRQRPVSSVLEAKGLTNNNTINNTLTQADKGNTTNGKTDSGSPWIQDKTFRGMGIYLSWFFHKGAQGGMREAREEGSGVKCLEITHCFYLRLGLLVSFLSFLLYFLFFFFTLACTVVIVTYCAAIHITRNIWFAIMWTNVTIRSVDKAAEIALFPSFLWYTKGCDYAT